MKFVYAEDATPFNQDDASQLIPKHITTQNQLNEWEQANIILAERWLFSRKQKNLINPAFLQTLHCKMFDKTWRWAGKFRQHQTNIGVSPLEISVQLKILCDDVQFWINNQTFSKDEIAIRFHHHLVQIHSFPNGNGRHSRLITDALLIQLKCPRFTWGQRSLTESTETRREYITALKLADQYQYEKLFAFARS